MRLTFGVFKEVYQGQGIYWQDGAYNIEGNGQYKTLREAREAVAAHNAACIERERAEKAAKAQDGKHLVARRIGDGATIQTPEGLLTFSKMREARKVVFELEDKYGMEIVWITEG